MSTDLLALNEQEDDHNIDMLLNMIGTNEDDQMIEGDATHHFPLEYDWNQPAKSWWRYFKKQTDRNTAMCYTCGAIFNRGPKQSTTSLSHHLKMYHREQFILIQQAKDEDLRHGNKSSSRSGTKRRIPTEDQTARLESNDDYLNRKKSAFNLSLIEAVRQRPSLYDNHKRQADDKQVEVWEEVANEIGVSAQVAKKCWQSLCQRYRKEMKIAMRDNFLYKPKWPYFWDLNFLDEYFKLAETRRQSSSPAAELPSLNYLNGSNLFNNIFNVACAKSPQVDEEEDASTDSAIASSEHSAADQECPPEQVIRQKPDPAFITIQQLFSTASNDQLKIEELRIDSIEKMPAKRGRARKTAPTRLPKPPIASTSGVQGSFDWLQDEDMLFGKIVALRLRNLHVDQKRQMKILIEQIFERQERGLPLKLFDD